MTVRFAPGQRVEFPSLMSQRVFRGVIEAQLAKGFYWFVDDGQRRGRIVSGYRLRPCAAFRVIRSDGGSAA